MKKTRQTEGERGKEMQLNKYVACFKPIVGFLYETQYVAAGVDSVGHRHKLVCVGNTGVADRKIPSKLCPGLTIGLQCGKAHLREQTSLERKA